MSNSVDPDETTFYEPSHLDLRCLQKPVVIAYGSERVKNTQNKLSQKKQFSIALLQCNHAVMIVSSKRLLLLGLCVIVEIQWLKHLWDHGNLFETWVVRATEGLS